MEMWNFIQSQTNIIFVCVCGLMVVWVVFCPSGKGRGRGRSRQDDDEDGGARPSGPSTLFDFLESKMGAFSIDGKWNVC